MAEKKNTSMEEIGRQLEQGVRALFTTEQYTTYLKAMDKFHEYSFNNQVLIASQKPEATLVAGYRSWEKNFNRHVKKGEKGIRIIAPVPVKKKVQQDTGVQLADGTPQTEEVVQIIPRFRSVTVFDVSQTEGEPLPERPNVQMLTDDVESFDAFMHALEKISPVPIRFDEISGTANGYYDATEKEIVIRRGMSESQTVKTAIHETVHARLHDPDNARNAGRRTEQVTREVEAESTAFLVCHHFGIDTGAYTFPYIAAWSSSVEMKELRSSMDRICDAATEIIDDLTAQLEPEREAGVTLPEEEKEQARHIGDSVPEEREIGKIVYAPAFDNGQWKVTAIDLEKVRWTGSLMEHNGLVYDRDRDMYRTEEAAWKSIRQDPEACRDLVKFDDEHKPYLVSGRGRESERYHEDTPLPSQCYSVLPSTGEIIIVKRGEQGYYRTTAAPGDREKNRELADLYNAKYGITREQEDALVAGSMFGPGGPQQPSPEEEEEPLDREAVEELRADYPPGTRVELVDPDDPQTPVDQGTVLDVDDEGVLHIDWDSGFSPDFD
ncbi:MAG: DUF4314 domain-containing protein, partial [Oscillospiraceae bacterium]|nr:DUF4314 domain-containing protein [Oscillospiraceae bacterium]